MNIIKAKIAIAIEEPHSYYKNNLTTGHRETHLLDSECNLHIILLGIIFAIKL